MNFLVYKLDSWSDYQIDLYSLRCEYVAERLKNQKEIRIGLVPFTGVPAEKFLRIRDIDSDFIIEGIRDEDTTIGKVLYTMERLKEEGVDIVVFPEMTFTPKLLGEVKNYLRSNLGSFLLIVCGSIWEYGRNYSILLNGNGHELLKQYKNNIYHKTEEFSSKGNNEGLILDSSKRKIKVLDIEILGGLLYQYALILLSLAASNRSQK